MGTRSANVVESEWRRQLPTLVGREVVLREPDNADLPALAALLSLADSSRFGVGEPVTADEVRTLFERCIAERAAGVSFTYLTNYVAPDPWHSMRLDRVANLVHASID